MSLRDLEDFFIEEGSSNYLVVFFRYLYPTFSEQVYFNSSSRSKLCRKFVPVGWSSFWITVGKWGMHNWGLLLQQGWVSGFGFYLDSKFRLVDQDPGRPVRMVPGKENKQVPTSFEELSGGLWSLNLGTAVLHLRHISNPVHFCWNRNSNWAL